MGVFIDFKKLFFLIKILLLILFISCDNENDNELVSHSEMNTCVGCHTNYEVLKDVYTPVPDSLKDSKFIEPYDRVFIKNIDEFTNNDPHGKMACTDCHNGISNTVDKVLAHKGTKDKPFIKHPSTKPLEKCVPCHQEIAEKVETSIHKNGWGMKSKVSVRYGLNGAHEFDQLTENMKKGYETNCASCHSSCGECHVNRPIASGGGLLNNHMFQKTPDMSENCIACHSKGIGQEFLGEVSGSKPDVHLTKAGFNCLNCHSRNEVHGDGTVYETRFHVAELRQCTDCHKLNDIQTKNLWHTMHINNLSCYVCHSQPYNNCGSCHIGSEGIRISAYKDFKIGDNPIKNTINTKTGSQYDINKKWSLVRRTPMAPDSWGKYGINNLANFDALPVYNYTAPHNIQRFTPQTSGKTCFAGCHISKTDSGFVNKELYLFESDLEFSWEKSSSLNVTVDGKLPKSWGL